MRGLALIACALVLFAGTVRADVPDAGPADAGDVPMMAHVDAGDPAPFTGDEFNTAAERHVLAACGADAGAPVVAPPPSSSCASLVVPVVTALLSAAVSIYLHQRVTH